MKSRPEGRVEFECTLPKSGREDGQRWVGEVFVRGRSPYMAELLIYGRGSRMDAIVGGIWERPVYLHPRP